MAGGDGVLALVLPVARLVLNIKLAIILRLPVAGVGVVGPRLQSIAPALLALAV